MLFNKFSEQITVTVVNGKKYALVPLCTFHDIDSRDRSEILIKSYGLRDMFSSVSIYEIEDERKLLLAKLKYDHILNDK